MSIEPAKKGRPFEWTDEKVAELKRLAAAGKLSMGGMGAELGVSRCAIGGKLHRLGIKTVPITRQEEEARFKRKQERAAARIRNQQYKARERKMEAKVDPVSAFDGPLNIPFNDLRSFSELSPNECRFIPGEPPGPNYLACGNPTKAGESYCAHCKTIVFRGTVEVSDAERARRSAQMRRMNKPAAPLDIIDEAA